MNIKFVYILLVLILFSCKEEKHHISKEIGDNNNGLLKQKKPDFDHNFLSNDFLTFLNNKSEINNKKDPFYLEIDTLKIEMLSEKLRNSTNIWSFLIKNSESLIKYSYKSKEMSINIHYVKNSDSIKSVQTATHLLKA